MKSSLNATLILSALMLSSACSQSTGTSAPGYTQPGVITGTVSYRERIALSPMAELTVQLQDISVADTPARLLAEKTMMNIGQVPVAFTLEYDPTLIDLQAAYAVRATISDRGQLLFTSDTVTPVLTRGNGNTVEMRLASATSATQVALTDTAWQLVAVDGDSLGLPADHRMPDLLLTDNPPTARGFSGCNQFSGTWQLENDQISFGPMAMTMMACMDGMDIEQRYMQALTAPMRFAIEGNTLRFLTGNTEVLTFRAAR